MFFKGIEKGRGNDTEAGKKNNFQLKRIQINAAARGRMKF